MSESWRAGASIGPAGRNARRKTREVLAALLSDARVTFTASVEALEVLAVDTSRRADPGYLLLDEAIERGFAVEEAPGGKFSLLVLRNPLRDPVLVLDGDVLVGGRQDRVANATVLVGGGTAAALPVSSVEVRRREGPHPSFKAGRSVAPIMLRRGKASSVARRLLRGESPVPDQGEVWNDVAAYYVCLGNHSPTGRLEGAFDPHEAVIEQAVAALELPDALEADGIATAIGGALVSLELFESPAVLRRYYRRAIRAHVLDAIVARRMRAEPPRRRSGRVEAGLDSLLETLSMIPARDLRTWPSPGGGVDVRLTGLHVVGSGLMVGERLVALSAFPSGGFARG